MKTNTKKTIKKIMMKKKNRFSPKKNRRKKERKLKQKPLRKIDKGTIISTENLEKLSSSESWRTKTTETN